MWQKFDNSINRDNNRDNREEARIFLFLCSYVFFNREETRSWEDSLPRMTAKFLCSYVLMSFLTANCANVADIR